MRLIGSQRQLETSLQIRSILRGPVVFLSFVDGLNSNALVIIKNLGHHTFNVGFLNSHDDEVVCEVNHVDKG